MASASKSRRSRKRRPHPGAAGQSPAPKAPPRAPVAIANTPTAGARPRPPWHPLPLSELLILVGALGVVVGLQRGGSHGTAPLAAGLVAVGLGTFEVTAREHFSGYRSHAILLALLPVLVFHTVVVLGYSKFATVPGLLTLALLPLDVALFVALFKLLRTRFLEARRARTMGRR
jgi:hypothetical protein